MRGSAELHSVRVMTVHSCPLPPWDFHEACPRGRHTPWAWRGCLSWWQFVLRVCDFPRGQEATLTG